MIECWLTTPAGVYIAHLDRSQASPFRRFAVSRMRGADPGVGSLEYHRDNALVAATPGLFADGNLVWMKYNGRTLTWIVEERKAVLDDSENATDWIAVSGRGVKQLVGDRIVWPSEFDEAHLDPSKWGLGGWSTILDDDAASGDAVIPVESTSGAVVGIPVQITGRPVGAGAAGQLVGVIQSIDVGVSVTLEDDLTVSFRKGSRILGATQQWRRFVNRSCGEMLWDLIAESNARFATQIVRGTIEADAGWTQDLRFDNLLEVVDAVTKSYGDIEMDGLTFSYHAAPGTNRSAIFEEGADLLKVERAESDRDTISWVVAEGVGEGSMATLAVSEDATIGRRREGYLDAKDAANAPLVQLRANAAIDELAPVDSIAVEVTAERFAPFTDYDVHDTVRVIAPSRGIDASAVIVGMYLVEGDDERIRVGFDLSTPRQEYLIGLEEGNRSTANSLGVRNRQPQGQSTVINFADSVYFDSTTPSASGIYIPDDIYVTTKCRLAIHFDSYPMPVSAAASSGSLTSDSGGGSTSGSGGSSTPTSGASSASTSDDENVHYHAVADYISATPHGWGAHEFHVAGGAHASFDLPSNGNIAWVSDAGTAHHHGQAHTHVVTIGTHGHSTPDHQHTVPGHSHSLTPASTKEAYPASHNVTLKVYNWDDDAAWDLVATISGITEDVVNEDLILYITGPGQWDVRLQSAGGQPNGGRIGAHLMGFLVGAIQSA